MNTWISRRYLAALIASILVSGCVQTTVGNSGGSPFRRQAPETISVARGAVTIGGPSGYCVDRRASRLSGETAFVLLGSCAAISGDPSAATPTLAGLLTASVAEGTGAATATEPALDQLSVFLASETGRAALARNGLAESVDILETRNENGAILVRLADTSSNTTPGLHQTYWRGFLDLKGRLITLSVMSFEQSPLPSETGLETLRGFLARTRAETPG